MVADSSRRGSKSSIAAKTECTNVGVGALRFVTRKSPVSVVLVNGVAQPARGEASATAW
jgi:hypothetical protein